MNNLSNRLKMFTKEIKTNKTNPITEIEVEKQLLDEQYNNNLITEEEYEKQITEIDNKLKEVAGKDTKIEKDMKFNELDRIMNESGKQNGEYHNLEIDIVKQLPRAIQ